MQVLSHQLSLCSSILHFLVTWTTEMINITLMFYITTGPFLVLHRTMCTYVHYDVYCHHLNTQHITCWGFKKILSLSLLHTIMHQLHEPPDRITDLAKVNGDELGLVPPCRFVNYRRIGLSGLLVCFIGNFHVELVHPVFEFEVA